MKTSELLNYYLTTLHSLQDYLVGFALLQTVTFLYGLKTFGSLIYPHKNLITIAIVVVNIFNWIVLATTTVFEVSITDLIVFPKDNLYLNLKSTIYRAFLLRGALITLINFTSAGLFYVVARHNLKTKIIIN